MDIRENLFIGGAWRAASSGDLITVRSPSTEDVVGTAPSASLEDLDKAVAAARAAFPSWSNFEPGVRADYLDALCSALEQRTEQLVAAFADELGAPRLLAERLHLGFALAESRVHIGLAREFEWEQKLGNSVIRHEPIGVVGAITPWNIPLVQVMRKVAPALAAGCTVVLKPASYTPFDAYLLADAAQEIGLPAGVLNVVTGSGALLGEGLASHPDVDVISLTGSVEAGRRVAELAAQTVKRVSLELGGKSPAVVLPGADLEKAVTATLASCYTNSGQACSAITRLIVPRESLSEVESIAAKVAGAFVVGRPEDESTRLGPLVSAEQKKRVVGLIDVAVAEGAKVVVDGRDPGIAGAGHFVGPTVLSDVVTGSVIATEEVFGPVLSIIPVDTLDEAVAVANDTVYGLAAAVWGPDDASARDVAVRISAGKIDINGGSYNFAAPFGGYKQSGIGRENGRFGFEEYLEVKSMQF